MNKIMCVVGWATTVMAIFGVGMYSGWMVSREQTYEDQGLSADEAISKAQEDFKTM